MRSLLHWSRSNLLIWSNLRAIGNHPLVKATLLIPVIGYLVIFNNSVLPYLELSTRLFAHASLVDLSWRLVFIYFGLCSLAVGSLIYQVFCPIQIKQSQTAVDYVAASRAHLGDIELGRIEAILARTASTMEEFVKIRDHTINRAGGYSDKSDRDKIYEQYWPDVLTVHFNLLNRSRPAAQVGSLLFYSLGFLMLAIPSVSVFIRIASVSVHLI